MASTYTPHSQSRHNDTMRASRWRSCCATRYCARPPIAQERLQELPTGRIALQLKTPWHDGSTHVVYEPLDLIAKLAALIPRPRKNIVLYHGVLSANAAWRSRVVAYGRAQTSIGAMDAGATSRAQDYVAEPMPPRCEARQWAELMRRSFGHDLLACAQCGGKLKLVDVVLERIAIRRILSHLRLPSDPPAAARARASPEF
jgi:hypothetical protein